MSQALLLPNWAQAAVAATCKHTSSHDTVHPEYPLLRALQAQQSLIHVGRALQRHGLDQSAQAPE